MLAWAGPGPARAATDAGTPVDAAARRRPQGRLGRARAGAAGRRGRRRAARLTRPAPGRPGFGRWPRWRAATAGGPPRPGFGPLAARRTRQTRQRAAGSLSGSPCTSVKWAGPPTVSLPACGSPSTSPPRQVADAERLPGLSPARTSAFDLPGEVPARTDPPPKSLPAAIGTPAACATRMLASATSSRSAMRRPLSGPVKRSRVVVVAKPCHECRTESVDTTRYPVGREHPRDVRVDREPVLQRVDGRLGREPAIGQASAVRGDGGAACVHGVDDPPHLVSGPRGDVGVRAVQVQLDQVGAVVELAEGGREQRVGVPDFDGQAGRQRAAPGHPGSGRPHVGIARPAPPLVPQGQREGAFAPVAECPRGAASRRHGPSGRLPRAAPRRFARPRRSGSAVSSAPRATQCAPPCSVRWLWQSTKDGTIVAPLASMTLAPAPGFGRRLAVEDARSRARPPTSTLTGVRSTGLSPSASAAPS